MRSSASDRIRIAELEAQVRALEAALKERSAQLRELQRWLCPRDLRLLDLLVSLESADTALSLESWDETTELRPAEVDEALEALWARLSQAHDDAAGDGSE